MTKNSITSEAPALIGIGAQSIVQRAASLGLTWNLRPATVMVAGSSGVQITYDGDTRPINCVNVTDYVFTVGDRVMGMFVPPSGNYIIGSFAHDAWHPFVFQNGWTNQIAGEVDCQYRKNPATNNVQLVGEMTGGTIASNTVVTTLPVGYRPLAVILFPIAVNPSPAAGSVGPLFRIDTTGALSIFGATTGCTVYFSAIFPLDATG